MDIDNQRWKYQEPITGSVKLPYWTYVTAFLQNGLFLDYLFAGNRLLELTWVIRSMKRGEKNKWRPYTGTSSYQNYPSSVFCCIPVFQSFLSLYNSLSFTNFSHLCKNLQECGSSLYFYLYIYIYFFEFSCVWKVILLLILALLKKISWKESKFKTIKRRNASDDEERGNKKFREQAVCDLSSSQESISTQSVKKCDAFMN